MGVRRSRRKCTYLRVVFWRQPLEGSSSGCLCEVESACVSWLRRDWTAYTLLYTLNRADLTEIIIDVIDIPTLVGIDFGRTFSKYFRCPHFSRSVTNGQGCQRRDVCNCCCNYSSFPHQPFPKHWCSALFASHASLPVVWQSLLPLSLSR